MTALNQVQLIGNLGKDPEIRKTQSGQPVASMRIATSETWKDKQTGEKKERTEWHSVVVFSEGLCEVVEKYVRKGHKVFVQGQLATRKWAGEDCVDRYMTEVVLRGFDAKLVMLTSASGNRPPAATEDSYGAGSGDGGGSAAGQRFRDAMDDDIPFAPEVR